MIEAVVAGHPVAVELCRRHEFRCCLEGRDASADPLEVGQIDQPMAGWLAGDRRSHSVDWFGLLVTCDFEIGDACLAIGMHESNGYFVSLLLLTPQWGRAQHQEEDRGQHEDGESGSKGHLAIRDVEPLHGVAAHDDRREGAATAMLLV